MKDRKKYRILGAFLMLAMTLVSVAPLGVTVALANAPRQISKCDDNAIYCAETAQSANYGGGYTGHDEPSVLYYSNVAGAGNYNVYYLTLPKDPPMIPTQDGKGGTFNFQLHPAFWFGMAMCDSQSAPNPGMACAPNTDANIFDSADPAAADYIGKHPGTAFMEMQFYPPGWAPWPAGNSCDATKWCAALTIDSLSENMNTGQLNNSTCLEIAGLEYVNFAFITKNGVAHAPANPVNATAGTFIPNPGTDLFMNSGDKLKVLLHDTPGGFQVVINDLTSGESGLMTASAANSFGQVQFAPGASTACNNIPYNFHPMYSTSSEHTRVPWAAHSYNVAFSDEIGHFEYCNQADTTNYPFPCVQNGVSDPAGIDEDDIFCFNPVDSTRIQIGGCTFTDNEFDGVPYQTVWPGTNSNPGVDQTTKPASILFSSPLFRKTGSATVMNFSRVAFEADLPRIEAADFGGPCNRTTGAGCVNPPPGANFYPFFTTRANNTVGCTWQLGGSMIPGTKNTFGGSSTAEFGPLLQLAYPRPGGVTLRYNNFRQVLSSNPCAATTSFGQ